MLSKAGKSSHLCMQALLLTIILTAVEITANPAKEAAGGASIVPSAGQEAFFERCPQGSNWVKYNGACYWWSRNVSKYWEPAEQKCKTLHGGHLTSVANHFEDSFIAKLTYCRPSWIGLYAVNVDLLDDYRNYRWTDNSTMDDFKGRNFTGIPNVHYPLVSTSNLEWKNNVYHARHPYVCKVDAPQRNATCDCPKGWSQLNDYCYFMPNFKATYVEADYYCRGRNAFVTSVHSQQELRALSLLDIESYGCPFDTWIGLLKLNPCRVDFSTGKKICYRWSDRSGDYKDLPAWQSGNPSDDQVTNCVLLQDEEIRTVPCHTRARFVCKKRLAPIKSARQCQV